MHSHRVRAAMLVLAAFFAAAGITHGQSAYKAGDKIQVMHLRQWRDAVVVQTNQRGEVQAEFEFAGRPRREVFRPADIRFQYEADALSRGRFWSDASQKFRVKAALLKIGDKEVTLRKQDLSEINVAIEILSEADKAFLKKVQTESPAAVAAARVPAAAPTTPATPTAPPDRATAATAIPPTRRPPPIVSSTPTPPPKGIDRPPLSTFTAGGLSADSVGDKTKRTALEPDPVPSFQKMQQGGVGIPQEDYFDHVARLLPVGGSEGWLLASVEGDRKLGTEAATRVLWISLNKQKVENRQLLPAGETVLDYHAPSHRLLSYGEESLTLWDVIPTGKEATPLVRWKVAVKPTERYVVPWARVIDASHVLQRIGKQEYVCWDTTTKRSAYRTTQEAAYPWGADLSGGRRYLFLPEEAGVRIIEAATGKFLSTLPVGEALMLGDSEDGRQLAVLNSSHLTIWNLTSATEEPQTIEADTVRAGSGARKVKWLSPERLMFEDSNGGEKLFSLKSKATIWRYTFDAPTHRSAFAGRDPRVVVDGHLVYSADLGEAGQRGVAVGAVKLPGPNVDEAEAATKVELAYIVKPGTEFRLQVEAGDHTARVQQSVQAKVLANGWKISANSPNVLLAEIKVGENQQIQYYDRSGKPAESISFAPHISSLKLSVGEQVAWQSATSNSAPPFITLRGDETAQGEADKRARPWPEFFDNLKMPQRILDPTSNQGLGVTSVTSRGLTPKPAATEPK